MQINNVDIKNTYAEGFGIKVTRILVTAATAELAKIAATEATGYGTSVIGCPAEAGIDCYVPASETPDGRPGYVIMICHASKKALDHELMERIGMCILTAPTAAAFNLLESEDVLKTGFKLKYFGDGFEKDLEIAEHVKSSCDKIKDYYKDCPSLKKFNKIFNNDLDDVHGRTFVVGSLECVIHCLLNTDNYEDAVLKAVNFGEDTDTTAAICGGLAGIYYGFDAIPIDWLKDIYKLDDILSLCENYEGVIDECF